MACRALEIRLECGRDGNDDPLGRDVTGSVVGIQVEVVGMYTGTLIEQLTAAVVRAEQKEEQRRVSEELHEIFTMQIPMESDHVFEGAA